MSINMFANGMLFLQYISCCSFLLFCSFKVLIYGQEWEEKLLGAMGLFIGILDAIYLFPIK